MLTVFANNENDEELIQVTQKLSSSINSKHTVDEFAKELGCEGFVTGYVYHSVPVALFAWLRYQNEPQVALEFIIQAGGDTDSTGAIVGALCGAQHGTSWMEPNWLTNIASKPLTVKKLRYTARYLTESKELPNPKGFGLRFLFYNIALLFALVVFIIRRRFLWFIH